MATGDGDEWLLTSGPTKPKRTRTAYVDVNSCIIHCTDDVGNLSTLSSLDSWQTLLHAAQIRQYKPLLEIAKTLKEGQIPEIRYHRQCRSSFTHKKSLESLDAKEGPSGSGIPSRRSIRSASSESRVLDAICIFCQKVNKYLKGNCKESLIKCVEIRADEAIRKAAVEQQDSRILAITQSHELVAAEAQYHVSCYKSYTRKRPLASNAGTSSGTSDHGDEYSEIENTALQELYSYIRNEVIAKLKVVTVVDLRQMLLQRMRGRGIETILESTKKNFRRKLETEFESSVHIFPNEQGKLIFLPSNISVFQLAMENQRLKEELDTWKQSKLDANSIQEGALKLRAELKSVKDQLSWPPQPSELRNDVACIPPLVKLFLQCLLTGTVNDDPTLSCRVMRHVNSFYQDFLFSVSGGKHITPKHVLLPFAVKSLTGNVELIKVLNRLGHGVSYSRTLEIDTAFALQKLALVPENGIVMPEDIHPNIPTSLVFDNIDRLEETLSGAGTSHRVNGIAVQRKIIGPHPKAPTIAVRKTKQRSLHVAPFSLPIYNAGEKPGPPVVNVTDIDFKKPVRLAWLKNLVWVLTRQVNPSNQIVSSWTGFNIQVRKDMVVIQDSVGYLPTIDAPATSMSTIYEVLCQALRVKDALNLNGLVVVCDQAIYAKAVEIAWKHDNQFSSIVLRLGVFHTACTLLAIIGKRFADAGLRDICIEAEVIAEGSVDSVLEGRRYNRAVRLHKLIYEACMRLIWRGFLTWITDFHSDQNEEVDDLLTRINTLRDNLSSELYKSVLGSDTLAHVTPLFEDYIKYLQRENGSMSAFWMSYVDLVDILLNLLRASREGNWPLHLASIRAMIPWCFAYDRTNYARYLPWYLQNMLALPTSHPEIHQYLEDGGFSVQLGPHNTFGKIPMDQTIEETANKDTQTPGGTKGFSTRPDTVARYYMTADYKSACIRQLREMVDSTKDSFSHPDMTRGRIERDETDIESILDMLQNNWRNPFSTDVQDLCSLSTGLLAPADVASDMLSACEKGEVAYSKFMEGRLSSTPTAKFHDCLPKLKLKNFSTLNKTKMVKTKGKEVILTADRKLFGQMVLIAQSRQLSMKDVLKHPLGPLPWALATGDGSLRKTNKATLGTELEKSVAPAEDIPQPSTCIIDGMSVVQKIMGNHRTFADLSETIFRKILNESHHSMRVDVVFDVYRDISIKNAERTEKRGASEATQFKNILRNHKIQQWRKFLAGSGNKTSLIQFLCKEWKTGKYQKMLNGKVLFLAYEQDCDKVTETGVATVPALQSTHEEADTRLLLHAKHAAAEGYKGVIIVCEDTDVLIMSLAVCKQISAPLFQKRGTQTRTRYVDICKLASALGGDMCNSLLGLHAFTGCDTVSSFAGRGKLSALKLTKNDPGIQSAFSQLGQQVNVSSGLFTQLEAVTCELYGSKNITDVNELRYINFCAKRGDIESQQLPPCRDSLHQHILRANYQAHIWRQCLCACPDVPSPDGHGWKIIEDGNDLTIDWISGLPAPETVLELLSCECSRSCTVTKCTCMNNGLKCTDMCRLKSCSNQAEVSVGDNDMPHEVDMAEDEDEDDD